jgi:hypothetical protein
MQEYHNRDTDPCRRNDRIFVRFLGLAQKGVSAFKWKAGWPDELVKKSTQSVAQPVFCQNLCITFTVEKVST